MVGKISFDRRSLRIDGKIFMLLGGEIHYFRLPSTSWKDRLQKARDGGLNTVTSYIPWYWHEPQEGKVDIEGGTLPERNLRLFMDMVAESGLKMIARPGPFVNSELRYGGFPEWLFRDHKETLSRKSDGNPATGRPIPAEGEPVYRQYVRKWYSSVIPLIAEYDIHRGGPMILFQPENELSAAWSYGLLNSLYDPCILEHYWPAWLKNKYRENVEAVNNSHKAHYRTFEDVDAPRAFPASEGERRRCLDWMEFKRWFFADWGATLADWAREEGIEVPVIFNEPVAGFYGHGDHAGFGKILNDRGYVGFTACHTYSERILDLDGITNPVLGAELVKSSPWNGPAMSVEINVAWHTPRLYRSEINWESLMRLGLSRDLSGFVIYPYATGIGPLKDTIDGPLYWNQSCLDLEGHPNRSYHSVKRFYEFMTGWREELAPAPPREEIILAYTPGQRLLDFLGTPQSEDKNSSPHSFSSPGGESFDTEPTLSKERGAPVHDWLDGYEGVSKQTVVPVTGMWHRTKEAVVLLNRLNAGWSMLNMVQPNRKPGKEPIIVPCCGFLETEAISYLLEHLNLGGSCMFFPTIPTHNIEGHADKRLADRLGISADGMVQPAGGSVMDYGTRVLEWDDGEECGVDGWVWHHSFPLEALIMASYANKPVAGTVNCGKGKVTVAGFDMSYVSESTLKIWQSLVRKGLNWTPDFKVQGNWLHGVLRRGQNAGFLTLINITGQFGQSQVTISLSGNRNVSFNLELKPHAARCLVVDTVIGNGIKLLYSNSEATPLDEERYKFNLSGCPGTQGETAFDRPLTVLLNGREEITYERDGMHIINYTHQESPLQLSVKNPC